MKLLSVHAAKSIWLTRTSFFNPTGTFIRPLLEDMKSRYEFESTPKEKPPTKEDDGYKFTNGKFNGKTGPVVVSWTVHTDGLVAETRSSTADSEAFLEELVSWVGQKYGLPRAEEIPITRAYSSELYVSFSKAPKVLNEKLTSWLKEVSTAIGGPVPVDFTGLQLATDPSISAVSRIFRFEREVGTPFKENRYYTSAPMTTEAHLRLLESMEKLVS